MKQSVTMESTSEGLSFKWSVFRISSTDSRMLQNIFLSDSGDKGVKGIIQYVSVKKISVFTN